MSDDSERGYAAWALAELQEALAAPGLPQDDTETISGEEGCQAAYELAVALGRCRVFGVEVPEQIDGDLWPNVAAAAAARAAELVGQRTEDAKRLPSDWEAALAAVPEEAESLCAEMLEDCMEVYFAVQSIDEAYQRAVEEGELPQEFDQAYWALIEAISRWDDELQKPDNLALLSTVVSLPLLDNWRACLAGQYCECPPWWLDGTLEAADREIAKVVEATLPSSEQWRKLRELAHAAAGRTPPAPARRHRAAMFWSIAAPIAAAAQAEAGKPPLGGLLYWKSPDALYRARLSIPSKAPEDVLLPLELLDWRGRRAGELSGQPVRLGGLETRADKDAVARFALRELRRKLGAADAEVVLEVGPEWQEWLAVVELDQQGAQT